MKRLIGIVIVLVFLAGCATTAASSTSTNTSVPATSTTTAVSQRASCQALAKVDAGLASLSTVGDNTTVGTVKTIQQQVGQQLTALDTLIPGDAGPVLSQLTSANDQLGSMLQGLPDSASLSQTSVKVQKVQSKVADARTSASNLGTKLRCGP